MPSCLICRWLHYDSYTICYKIIPSNLLGTLFSGLFCYRSWFEMNCLWLVTSACAMFTRYPCSQSYCKWVLIFLGYWDSCLVWGERCNAINIHRSLVFLWNVIWFHKRVKNEIENMNLELLDVFCIIWSLQIIDNIKAPSTNFDNAVVP